MAISIKIEGASVVIARGSLTIEKRIEERSTASFIAIDREAAKNYVRGMPVEIYDSALTLIFTGFIDTPRKARLASKLGLLHSIICVDNHYLADKRLVVNSYQDKTAGYIFEDIFNQYLEPEGVTIGEIQVGSTIGEAIFNYVKVSDVYDAIKELSGTFTWFIDELKKLYFVDRATYAAPWNLDGIVHRAIKGSVYLSTGNPLYRNWQYIWGGTNITSLQVSNFVGDDETKTFTLGYPLAKVPIVKEDSVLMTVGIKGIDSGKDYYWTKTDAVIYAEVAPSSGVAIEVQYYGQYPLISMLLDSNAIIARKTIEGGTGIIEDIVREAWHESKESSRQSAQAKLTQYCQDAEKFTYQTHESGLAPGQLQPITYSPFGFDNHEMLIESVSVSARGDLILYDISCITGPLMGSWSKFFSKLLKRQDQSIRVGGDLLLKFLQQMEALSLSETTDLHSDDFSGYIVNRWIALPPTQSRGYNVEHEKLALAEAPSYWSKQSGQYAWAPHTSDTLKEAVWDFFSWG